MPDGRRRFGRAARARERAEKAARRFEKRRADKHCAAGHPACLGADPVARLLGNRSDVLWVRAAERSASACESMASVHERLAKAGSGDVADHCRRVADYRAAATVFRGAAAALRADG